MMRFFLITISLLTFSACKDKKIPDVSGIKLPLQVYRSEQEIFKTDSLQMAQTLEALLRKDGDFCTAYVFDILGADPKASLEASAAYVSTCVRVLKPVYEASEKIFHDFTPWEKELKQSFQFIKFYFPEYPLPGKIVTFIGSPDGTANLHNQHQAVYIGLQQHLGKDALFYQDAITRETYPDYKSRRFEPEYISVNTIENMSYDIYPDQTEGKSMILQMIENGKRLFLMSKLLPYKPEYMLIGYTEKQMKDCYQHEAEIWDLFTKNDLLHTNDKLLIRNYIGESPKTQELGEDSPGNIGSFAGWQIVKKYCEKFPELSLGKILQTDAELILEESKYKP